jgi:hypothetical protein
MNRNRKQDHVNRDDHDNDNDNGKKAIAPVPAGGALTSLAALQTALRNVDTAAVGGRSGLPMLLFKSREDNGAWMYGQKRVIPEKDSRWAVNPATFKWGFISFGENNKVVGEHLVSVGQPKPDITKLPDTGFPWQEEWSVNMKCLDGADAGIEVTFKATTNGGHQAVVGLIEAVRDRLNGGQHDGKVVPVVHLEKDSYQHPAHGRIWMPLLPVVDWMPLDGPVPAPEPAPPPTQQPRRRRVA